MADKLYDTLEEAQFRLNGTIIEYDGSPVYVRRVDVDEEGKFVVGYNRMPMNPDQNKLYRAPISDKRFRKFQPVRMGWCNEFRKGRQHASFLTREPVRRSKQGLSSDSFVSKSPRVDLESRDRLSTGMSFNEVTTSAGFVEMVRGEYPDFETALGMLIDDSSLGIDREWCLVRNQGGVVSLWYRKEPVALVFKGTIHLKQKFSYLKESIEANANLPNRLEIGV